MKSRSRALRSSGSGPESSAANASCQGRGPDGPFPSRGRQLVGRPHRRAVGGVPVQVADRHQTRSGGLAGGDHPARGRRPRSRPTSDTAGSRSWKIVAAPAARAASWSWHHWRRPLDARSAGWIGPTSRAGDQAHPLAGDPPADERGSSRSLRPRGRRAGCWSAACRSCSSPGCELKRERCSLFECAPRRHQKSRAVLSFVSHSGRRHRPTGDPLGDRQPKCAPATMTRLRSSSDRFVRHPVRGGLSRITCAGATRRSVGPSPAGRECWLFDDLGRIMLGKFRNERWDRRTVGDNDEQLAVDEESLRHVDCQPPRPRVATAYRSCRRPQRQRCHLRSTRTAIAGIGQRSPIASTLLPCK